jgi:DNA invertase Pin-like site-specific DNA recombinase
MTSANPPINVALFVRVSTKEQDYSRQVADLTAYAQKQNYQIAQIIHETDGRPLP